MIPIKGFKLDKNGDVVIEDGRIVMTEGKDLLRQTVESVLGTNKGEWPFNPDEGITFANILGKKIDENAIKHELELGLIQVDESFSIVDFELSNEERKFKVKMTAETLTGSQITPELVYG